MAKLTARDKKIIQIQEKIQKDKAKLAAISKFKPVTNLVLKLGNATYNLNVLSKDEILILIAQLVSISTNLVAVGISDTPQMGGYTVDEWISDLKGKYENLNKRNEEEKLTKLEQELGKLLSDDVQKDAELEKLLGNYK
jgi:hypothetical protein